MNDCGPGSPAVSRRTRGARFRTGPRPNEPVLIDFITAWVDLSAFEDADRERLRSHGERIQKYNPRTGEVSWEVSTWNSIRSDSHQISLRVSGDRLWFKGSPARVIGDGAARALDLLGCVGQMLGFVGESLGVKAPDPQLLEVRRVDITSMLLLDSLSNVRQGLAVLRNCEGGRYRVSQQAGDTVYWSHGSRLKSGKAYAKGPHLRQAQQKREYGGRSYSEAELTAVDRCLRLELTLGSQWWRERVGRPWWQVTADDLRACHHEYFGRMLGDVGVTEMNIEDRVRAVAATEGQTKAAVSTWALIGKFGWEKARDMTSRRTWYRNLKVLRMAGLADADLSAGNVVPFRRRLIECQAVNSWPELMAAIDKRVA